MTLTLENPEASPINEMAVVGYKISELGMIPEDWNIIQFSDLLEFRNGVNADKTAYGKGIPFINVLEVITHSHLSVAKVPGRITLPVSVASMYGIRYGDILFNRTSETQEELGLASTYISKSNEKIVFGGFVIRGRPIGNLLDAKYSGYAFRSSLIRSQIISRGQGAIRANIGQYDLSQIFIIIPPLKEQQAIAAALNDIDSLINSLDQLIAKKRNIKLGAMQQLFTGKQRLPGFSGEWNAIQLGFFGQCLRGVSYKGETDLSPTDNDHTIRLFRSNNIQNSKIIKNNLQYVASVKVSDHQVMRNNDILICMANGSKELVGKAGLLTIKDAYRYTFGAFMGCFRTNIEKADPRFVFYLLQSNHYRNNISNLLAGSSINNLKPSDIESIIFFTPYLHEQTAIANILSDMDNELSLLEQRLDKARNLKHGMMQELLTGRIRLK
ncbi:MULTISPECIES: restriction endonuclease subunit S [Parachlamydia]|uniref:restriction endonuclease subunit S n=1 Tax=Parachlamydia TaxID=83551 RepID=UPI000750A053|nr:restriction endonuclease subunit S [Parachlamydia acanthamoebae]